MADQVPSAANTTGVTSALTRPAAIEARAVTKRFPGIVANDQVSFAVAPGEVHALLGENGAGKSTLMNILYGLYTPDEGEILVNGVPTIFRNPREAIAQGIGMVHQHFMLIPPLTVTENIMLGNESRRGVFLDRGAAAARITALSERYGLAVNPEVLVGDLSVGAQQRVEILKAFYRDANVLILDEPTAVLTPQEADDLFAIMRGLREEGKSLIFITHKLREVLAIADRITVLRGGKVVGQANADDVTEAELARMMVGRDVHLYEDDHANTTIVTEEGAVAAALGLSAVAPEHPLEFQEPPTSASVLRVESLTVQVPGATQPALNDISFTIAAGEIFGIAGVEGNGQSELAGALTGLRQADGGHAYLYDLEITNRSPRALIAAGVAHIPEDRQKDGLVLLYPISDNLILSTYRQPPFAHGIALRFGVIRDFAQQLITRFDIRAGRGGVSLPAAALSGGNQQKVIVARELSRPIRFLVAAQPTRGLDVGSIEFIHAQLLAQREQGLAILLLSAELDELLALADRIGVLYRGKLVAVLPRAEATRERLGLLMAGGQASHTP